MLLRSELEPQVAVAEQRYSEVLHLLSRHDEAYDADNIEEMEAIGEQLRRLTGKDISATDLINYYEETSKGEFAVRLSLPAPKLVHQITNDELLEILRRLNHPVDAKDKPDELSVGEQISLYYLHDYYHKLLKLHFPRTYRYNYFTRQRRPDGSYYELTSEEQAALLLA